jgi:DNA polymerase sigma
MTQKQYHYIIIQPNYADLEREATLSHNKYNAKKKYAFINKGLHKDGSESIYYIDYSNDLEELQTRAAGFVSWYNYPLNLMKNIQGYISHIKN